MIIYSVGLVGGSQPTPDCARADLGVRDDQLGTLGPICDVWNVAFEILVLNCVLPTSMALMGSRKSTTQEDPLVGCQAGRKRQASLPVFGVEQCDLLWRQKNRIETSICIGYFVYAEIPAGGTVYVYFVMLFEKGPEII